MPYYERLAHAVIGSSLQAPIERLRDAWDSFYVLQHPGLKNIYEEDRYTKKLLADQLKDGMNCIDIGAHLGSVLEQFQRLSPNGQNIAFEALPYKGKWLKTKYPNVTVHIVALGETRGEVTFHYNPKQSGFSGLQPRTVSHRLGASTRLTLASYPLDEILPPDYRIDFIKIDVEGAELTVLRSGLGHIQRDRPPILFECCQESLDLFESTAAEVYGFFDELLNYDIFVIREFLQGGAPLDGDEFQQAMIYPFRAFNFFAVPR